VSRGHSERAFLFLEYPTFGHSIRIALSIAHLSQISRKIALIGPF
ncbi:unnamed protein product, partial [Acidithrix sp. C25]